MKQLLEKKLLFFHTKNSIKEGTLLKMASSRVDLELSCRQAATCTASFYTELSSEFWFRMPQTHGHSHFFTSPIAVLCQDLWASSCSAGPFLGFVLQVQLPSSSLFLPRRPGPHLCSMNLIRSFSSHFLICSALNENPRKILISGS